MTEPQRAHPILHTPREFGNATIDPRIFRADHQVLSLHWSARRSASPHQVIDRVRRKPTISVNKYNNGWWIRAKMPNAKVQGVALTNPLSISTLDDLCAGCGGHSRSIIAAIIGDNENPIAWK